MTELFLLETCDPLSSTSLAISPETKPPSLRIEALLSLMCESLSFGCTFDSSPTVLPAVKEQMPLNKNEIYAKNNRQ